MASIWLRAISPRGRKIYLVVATALFLLSMSLLVIRSLGGKLHLKHFEYNDGLYRAHQYSESSYLQYSRKEWEEKVNKDSQRGLTWLVQISDLHLHMGEVDEVQHFQEFVDDAISILRPAAVLVTGDLTNSKTHGVKLAQLPQEWSIYQRSVKDRLTVNSSTLWLDIAGNHDNFNEVQQAHFKAHAMQVDFSATQTAKATVIRGSDGQNITLLPLDASLKPGIRAYNFLGYLPEEEFKELQGAAQEARTRGDIVVFYGHYPTSTIISSKDVRKLLAMGAAYLCGHLHTGFGFVDTMWTKHTSGLLEVELADWFFNHRYRILAIDNGRVTWIDVEHPSWPVVIVSSVGRYPKGQAFVRYIVRLLVFTNEEISAVSVRVDNNLGHWITCKHRHGPLYTATVDVQTDEWEPQVTEEEFIRKLQVLVGNSSGSKSLLRVGKEGAGFVRPQPSYFGSFILSINLHDMFLMIYLTGIGMSCLLVLMGKYQVRLEPLIPKRVGAASISLGQNYTVFVLMMVFLLYPLIGPWYVGNLAKDKLGVVFMWGIFVDSSMLPGELTYPDAFFLWLTLQMPIFFIIFVKKMISFDSTRYRCGRWLTVSMLATVVFQLPSILAWLVLDSILLNGPLRLALTIIAILLWKKV
ncbi:transmembrane protein 62-like isoform X2 [Homarus americanus]|uniref:transmembrane protein 62-like isoform X2 n=1 Tax=Homarus americanus TaxID=6706 RepID=UPI001C439960|nr:transmembrane protein 62-like isoform X2 [Homarus americanus]